MYSLFWQGQKDAINRRFLALLDDPNPLDFGTRLRTFSLQNSNLYCFV